MPTTKTALVTGVSRGIGRGICQHLVKQGYRVHGTYNTSEAEAQSLSAELGDALVLHQANFCDRAQTTRLIENLSTVEFDAIVNNAGMIEFEQFDQFDFSIWDRTLETNVTAPLLIVQGLRDRIRRGGAIVNVASTDGFTGTFASVSYAASKAALLVLTKALGNLFGERGIRVTAVAPGWINTGMSTKASMAAAGLTPLGRNGTPEDVARVVTFLLSEDARFITGASLIVDGGYTNVDSIMLKEARGEL